MAFLISRNALSPRPLEAIPDPSARVLRAADYTALVQAQALLDEARSQADAILAGAQEACEAERRRGYEDGQQEALLDQAEKMIETVSRTVEYFAGVENEMVDLVMAAVRKVVDGFGDREKVRGNSKNFKGTQFYVSEQFPPEVAAKRRRIFRKVKERLAGRKAWVSYDTLYVDGKPVRDA